MYKIFTIRINTELHQCELIDSSEMAIEEGFRSFTTNNTLYSLIFANHLGNEEETQEWLKLIKQERIHYRLKPIEYYFSYQNIHNGPLPQNSWPFMEGRLSTPFAKEVFENLYYFSDQKELLTRQIEAGELVFSIFPLLENNKPINAQPLLEYTSSQSTLIKAECQTILRTIQLQSLKDAFFFFISNIQLDPSTLIKYLFVSFFAYAAAQNKFEMNSIKQNPSPSASGLNDKLVKLNDKNNIIPLNKLSPELMAKLVKEQIPNSKKSETYHLLEAIETDNVNNFKDTLKGFDLYKSNDQLKFLILQAARFNSLKIIDFIANTLKIDLNFFQSSEELVLSWLHTALQYNHDDLAEKLIKLGVNIDFLFNDDQGLMHLLVKKLNGDSEMNLDHIKKLVSLGADINLNDSKGIRPVFYALMQNQTSMVEFFLENNCITTLVASKYYNLLSIALTYSSLESIEFLLKRGFDPNMYIKNFIDGESVSLHEIPAMAMTLRNNIDIVDLMLKYGLNLSKYPKMNFEIIVRAISKNYIQLAYYLVKRGLAMDYFIANQQQLNKKDFPYADSIRTFLNTITEWSLYKFQLYEPKLKQIIWQHFHIDPDIFEIPELIYFYKIFQELQKSCIENNNKQFRKALTNLKSMPQLVKAISQIEKDNSGYKISPTLRKAFGVEIETKKIEKELDQKNEEKRTNHFSFFLSVGSKIFAFMIILYGLLRVKNIVRNELDQLEIKETEKAIKLNSEIKKNLLKEKKIELKNVDSKIIKIEENLTPKPLKILPKKSAEYKSFEKELISLNACIDLCKAEGVFYNETDKLLKFHNYSNNWFRTYKKMELARGKELRSLQNRYNNKISALLDNVDLIIKFKLADKLQILTICQSNIEVDIKALTNYLSQFSEEELNLGKPEFCNSSYYLEQLKIVQNGRDEYEILCKEAHNLAEDLEFLHKEIMKHKIVDEETIPLEILPEKTEKTALKLTKKKPILDNNIIEIKPKEKVITSYSNKFFVETNKIKEDSRLCFVNELFFNIEKIINDESDLKYKDDAVLYLLMKTSHLIAQLTSPKYGYKTIILPNQQIFYHLRNNIVHYPEFCFEHIDKFLFLKVYFDTFNLPLEILKAEGKCTMIDHTAIETLCPFLFKDNRNEKAIIEANNSRGNCLAAINKLVIKANDYYKEGLLLEKENKYPYAQILHNAMHGFILQFREKMRTLKKLDLTLFYKVNRLIPKIICSGHKIAHQLKEDDSWEITNEEREYYAQEDILPFSLLNLIKDIVKKENKIRSLCKEDISLSLVGKSLNL